MAECATASSVPTPYVGIGGRTRYRANCVTCEVVCTGWSALEALEVFEEHRSIPAPPDDLLAGPLTNTIFQKYCDYYIRGRGRPIASRSRCPHNVVFTDSPCGMCDDDMEEGEQP